MAAAQRTDQATLPIFRALIVVQLLAAGVFGLVPLLAPETFASLSGFSGPETLPYRLAGAATTGYAVTAVLALLRPRWEELRIPLVATCSFNAAAVVATVLSIAEGEGTWMVWFILVAASAFTLLSAYWLLRDEAPTPVERQPIDDRFRIVLLLATVAAAVFGIVPLVAARASAELGGYDTTDLFIFRLAAAATLGYAAAGILQWRASSAAAIRVQVIAAAAFNGLSAAAAGLYLVTGGRSPVALVVLVAATAFAATFIWWLAASAGRREVA